MVDKIKATMLHALTSAVIGARTHNGQDAVALTKAEEGKADGATIITDGGKATRIGASFAGSELMHSSLLFDSYRMLTHPGPVLVPAAIVNAELEGQSGKEIITALAAGYEFLFRLCDDSFRARPLAAFGPARSTARWAPLWPAGSS